MALVLTRLGLSPLEPAEEAKLGLTPAQHKVNERWIQEGKITDSDLFPWLRSVQLAGLELVIIGSSVDAVVVCNEAFHAGFKPVLIIVGDQVAECVVDQMIMQLAQSCWSRHPFRNGPVLIISDSSSCMVRLDDEGCAIDTYVRTTIGSTLSSSETWQYFKGPVVVVDPFMEDDDSGEDHAGAEQSTDVSKMRQRFLSRVKEEARIVADPGFWRSRCDPECFAYQMVTMRLTFLYSWVAGISVLCFIVEGHARMSAWFVPVRLVVNIALMVPYWFCAAIVCAGSLGFVARNWPSRFTLQVALPTSAVFLGMTAMKMGRYHFTLFSTFSVGMAMTLLLSLALAGFQGKVAKTNALWTLVVFGTPFIAFVLSILVVLLFLGSLNVISNSLAAVLVMFVFQLAEVLVEQAVAFAYECLVWQPRKWGSPNATVGDQRAMLSLVLATITGCFDSSKFMALICGCLRVRKIWFIGCAALGMVFNFAASVLFRSGWSHVVLGHVVSPRARAWICPRSPHVFVQDCKYTLWVTQFYLLAFVCAGRGLISGNWEFPALVPEDDITFWCWNAIVVVISAAWMIARLFEDIMVMNIRDLSPAPIWKVFGDTMQLQLDSGEPDSAPCHLRHYFSYYRKVDVSKQGLLSEGKLPRASHPRASRLDATSETDLLPRILASPNFKHTREVRHYQMAFIVTLQWILWHVVLTLAIGLGNYRAQCHPVAMHDVSGIFRRLILATEDCDS